MTTSNRMGDDMNDTTLGPVLSEHKGRIAAGGIGWFVGGLIFAATGFGFLQAIFTADFAKLGPALLGILVSGLWLFYNYTRYAQTLTIRRDGFVWTRLLRAPLVLGFADVADAKMTEVIRIA